MQRSEVVVSGLGPSAPLRVVGGATDADKPGAGASAAYTLRPTASASLSSGAVMTYQFEVTSDLPDPSGNWPSPGNWIATWNESGVQNASYLRGFLQLVTAVRINVLTYTSGTAAFRVLQ